jgi:hypothetical protein
MEYTFWFWFNGVSADRPGGPWWHRTFKSLEDLHAFRRIMEPCLRRYTEHVRYDPCQPANRLLGWRPCDERSSTPPPGLTVWAGAAERTELAGV